MEMVKIERCEVRECAYNRDGSCHALAITVGNGAGPQCDTFFAHSMKGGNPDAKGSVGACKMINCKHNQSLECSAPAIHVTSGRHKADCATFDED